MPPKKVTVAPLDPKQGSIQVLFRKPATTAAPKNELILGAAHAEHAASKALLAAAAAAVAPVASKDVLVSEDPEVRAFYSQLKPAELIAHRIAVDKLGTSYDVRRTHGFLKWLAASRSAAPSGKTG